MQYALPKNILNQIEQFDRNPNEIRELFEILKEQIILINKSEVEFNNNENNRAYEKVNNLKPKVNIELVKQLIRVSDTLKKIERYHKFNKLLPEIKKLQ